MSFVLRMNVLKRRAADLGTDVFHVVRFDVTEQREPHTAEDAERADKNPSAVPERKVP
jgi:hypothetical protein